MAKNEDKPGRLHSFLGGLFFTVLLVVIVPMLTAWFVGPIVNEIFEDAYMGPFTPSMLITAIMLLVMILFLLILGGGKIFKKYGFFGVVGLIAVYYLLGNVWDALLPVIIIIFLAIFTYYKERNKKPDSKTD
ncbi:MAG: hypothetical protein FWD92_05065 [Methanomassiliicoccaceae archaeon]|nr:hypothetical protein [Methanomassiliicoccaceae archaeon]